MPCIRPLPIVVAMLATLAMAGETALTGGEIIALLPEIAAIGDQIRQTFGANGRTTYTDRRQDSYGAWWVDGGQYCSRWPPNEIVACYDLLRDGETLIWVGDSGNRIINRIEQK